MCLDDHDHDNCSSHNHHDNCSDHDDHDYYHCPNHNYMHSGELHGVQLWSVHEAIR